MDNFERQKCWKTSQKDEVLTGWAPYNLLLKASSFLVELCLSYVLLVDVCLLYDCKNNQDFIVS